MLNAHTHRHCEPLFTFIYVYSMCARFKLPLRQRSGLKFQQVSQCFHTVIYFTDHKTSIIVLYIFLYSVQCCKSVKNGPVIPKSHNDITACFLSLSLSLSLSDALKNQNGSLSIFSLVHSECRMSTSLS